MASNFGRQTRILIVLAISLLCSGKQLLSLPVQSDNVYYAISPEGVVAVVDGRVLKVFELDLGGSRE